MNCVYVAKIGFDRLISSDFAATDFGLNFTPSSKNWSKKNSNFHENSETYIGI